MKSVLVLLISLFSLTASAEMAILCGPQVTDETDHADSVVSILTEQREPTSSRGWTVRVMGIDVPGKQRLTTRPTRSDPGFVVEVIESEWDSRRFSFDMNSCDGLGSGKVKAEHLKKGEAAKLVGAWDCTCVED